MRSESAASVDAATRSTSTRAAEARRKRVRVFMRNSPFSCPIVRGGQTPSSCAGLFFWGAQRRGFLARFAEKGRIGVGVLPQIEKLLIRLSRCCGVAGKCGGAGQPTIGQRVNQSPICTLMVQNLPELGSCFRSFFQAQVCQAAQINRLGGGAFIGGS